ncbi:denitrification regulatory protein nirq [Ophiostoma piceae UAMH 11346]|uniref:Midasin n=1 Tax=Ophiostoma piceae (strain UAMH 11346) TaxID=1262450 RepID=S3CA99_OPHP1|nr:denitrification regulatory protein nirq [Ophiostoma piceae UAMH 11346]
MAAYDVSFQRQSLLADPTTLGLLPPELLRVIQSQTVKSASSTTTSPAPKTHTSASFLDAIAQAALLPRLTAPLFAHFEPLFADICARWLLHSRRGSQDDAVLAAFARVLPLAPYLSILLDKYLSETAAVPNGNTAAADRRPEQRVLHTLSALYDLREETLPTSPSSPPLHSSSTNQPTDADVLRILLVLWRLVNLDASAYAQLVPAGLQTLFSHASPAVRYVAIRIFCLVNGGADFTYETLRKEHVPEAASLVADFDGTDADYTFLTLYEHTRCKDLHERVLEIRAIQSTNPSTRQSTETTNGVSKAIEVEEDSPDFQLQSEQRQLAHQPLILPLTPLVSAWGRSVIPHPASGTALDGTSTSNQPPVLIKTATTLGNLESLAKCLQKSEPILLRGLPGSGKTSLVREAARELGMESGLVTLHLNEQTDAKTLIGLYSTDSKPGSFKWRPGILTAAVQEGRWVLIEDLDRAPNEVMSTILPLIERRELLIPSRRETIKAPRNFRIFATVRTTLGLNGQETTRSLLGERLWQQLSVQQLPPSELRQVVHDSFPPLHLLVTDILSVFDQLTSLSSKKSGLSPAAIERPMTLRDLMKWCRRLVHVLFGPQTSSKSNRSNADGATPTITETALIGIFLDAVDCFAGSAKDERVRKYLGSQIAQALRIPPDVAEHVLTSHSPPFQDSEKQLTVGRVTLKKPRRAGSGLKPKGRPFATTAHARRLLEQIGVAVDLKEPLLLVGETGIGKTTVVQQLAESMGHKLVVVNLSQQSEVGDLLGGFKPVNARTLAMPLKEEFEDLFAATGISTEKNEKYLKRISSSIARSRWADVCRLWQQAPKMFEKIVEQLEERQAASRAAAEAATEPGAPDADGQPTKRRKTESSKLKALLDLRPRWALFSEKLEQFDVQVASGTGAFAFAFVEGKIVQAVRNGDWLLLDEINLASPDTLESIADLLSSGPGDTPSILLSETGEIDKIQAHPEFRVFGAMNPATDVGKRDLPIGLRSRFTELYVASPDRDVQDLVPIIKTYLKGNAKVTDRIIERVARLYLAIKGLAEEKRLVDGANEVPHYSLRTLTRVLRYVDDVAPLYGLERALLEGFCMGFLTLLSQTSENLVMPLILDHLLGDTTSKQRRQSILSQPPKTPTDGRPYVRFLNKEKDRQYWLMQGVEPPQERDDYIRTAYVERNLLNLVRATSTRRFPILIQGPTSAGKTSMIEYLAQFSGNKFVRINNHEHTDLQEYLGTYVSGSDGKLRFQEGVLVQAMRHGHWIVLDELNLAPTDVLEALNRLLDDNRELLIPETQEIVRPHESFMLFATQNPPGLYGGRKVLSRAFRNRFLELHFDDIPESELGYILQMRCRNTAPSDCERIVAVYKELSRLRQNSRVFEQKNSFATLRDLFRWALREADNREQIANHGFMLLAERVRDEEERMAVKGVIETIFKTQIDLDAIYGPDASTDLRKCEAEKNPSQQVVWTKAMRRLFVLVSQALKNREPILLVGETGCGKTTICQLIAEAAGRELHIVNAHQNTETGDLIGSQRPVRNRGAILESVRRDLIQVFTLLPLKEGQEAAGEDSSVEDLSDRYKLVTQEEKDALLPRELVERIAREEARSKALFEWSDGSLVHAMKTGSFFLLDEISLADDSVLERLNSVLEPQRTLLLAEKGVGDEDPSIQADDQFQFLATMNPGGDFGKKELSPALRNRFTEIWVPPLTDSDDVQAIVSATLTDNVRHLAQSIVSFSYWFGRTFRASSATPFSIRDILVLAQFVNKCSLTSTPEFALIHGAATVFIDTLGANPSAMVSADPTVAGEQRELCLRKLGELLKLSDAQVSAIYRSEILLRATDDTLWAGDFSIERSATGALDAGFEFDAPTTKTNVMRVVRALQMNHKPVLLEGNPGVGKTTLISALARACGQPLTRINLSDQTDLMDLFGTDVPVEGAEAGNFAWRDAPFLQAMQKGEWVLLDEMNLASQTVLEGLNACLDHRGEVYIAELDQTFKRHKDFRLFAAQNPHHQGGGRKGLPSSFVNRFIVVYADVFTEADQLRIANKRYPGISADTVRNITNFVAALEREVIQNRSFGLQGAPWEFNLRDTLRWLELAASPHASSVQDYFDITVRQRFRTPRDRQEVGNLFATAFGHTHEPHSVYHTTGASTAQIGFALMSRNLVSQPTPDFPGLNVAPRLPELESLLVCVQNNLPCILVGPSGSGKSVLLQHVAALAGKPLIMFPLSADVDAMDLVGGFEQADPIREVLASVAELKDGLELYQLESATSLKSSASMEGCVAAAELLRIIRLRPQSASSSNGTSAEEDYFARIVDQIGRFAPLIDASSELAGLLSRSHELLQQPLTLDNPRFEWLDSIIVQAAQAGHWLVLDNANLCNASVLDRLNSLLERPQGFLSINEHSGPDGSPRIVQLHPDFRVFLTVDPRYGELSRAMRNRSIEIFMDYDTDNVKDTALRVDPYKQHITSVETSMDRFLSVVNHILSADEAADLLWVDNLTLGDSNYLDRFVQALEATGLIKLANNDTKFQTVLNRLRALQSVVEGSDTTQIRSAIIGQCNQFANIRFDDASEGALQLSSLLVYEQPLHPFQNTPLVKALRNSPTHSAEDSWWLSVAYERYADVYQAHVDLQSQSQMASMYLSKLSMLTRLQRSSLVEQVASVKRDSTSHAYRFLNEVAQEVLKLCTALANLTESTDGSTERYMLNIVWHFWQQTHILASQSPFDEAKFQAHLGYGRRLLDNGKSLLKTRGVDVFQAFVAAVAQRVEDDFAAGFKLTTGLSIDVLWPVLRPLTIPDLASYKQITGMERLAARFDNLKWRVPAASVADLGKVMTSLAEAYRLLRTDGADSAVLVQALADEIGRLEALVSEDSERPGSLPLFADIFEAVRQLHVLYGTPGSDETDQLGTLVLSDLSTFSQLRLRSSVGMANKLQAVDHLLSQASSIRPWSGTLSSHLLRKCDSITTSSTLASLRSLENELPFVSKVVSRSSASLVSDPVAKLNGILWDLLVSILASHEQTLQATAESLLEQAASHPQLAFIEIVNSGLIVAVEQEDGSVQNINAQHVIWPGLGETLESSWPEHLGLHVADILKQHFLPAILALAVSNHDATGARHQPFASIAWVQYALGSIKLFTPDKVFDPYLKWQTEQDFDSSLRSSLSGQAAAIRQFDQSFLNQDATESTNLRLKLVEEDIRTLDANILEASKKQVQQQTTTHIYRPSSTGSSSELSRLQKDVFNPVLDVTVKDNLSSAHYRLVLSLLSTSTSAQAVQELQMIQSNVGRLIERLLASFTAYQDLAVPLANLLRCLQLGLSLSEGAHKLSDDPETEAAISPAAQWLKATPFLNGSLTKVEDIPSSISKSWEFLLFGGVCAAVDGGADKTSSAPVTAFSNKGRECIFESFHFFFDEWKKKLVADQKAEEDKNNLYRFRGSFEDEEEMDAAEFDELFPTFDDTMAEGDRQAKTGASSSTMSKSNWDKSADVAKIHRDILQPSRPATDMIIEFCKNNARKMAKENIDGDKPPAVSPSMDGLILPATMLMLDGKLRDLQNTTVATPSTSSKTPNQYNFYADTNLPEARKLVSLIHDIQIKFRSLQRVEEIGHLQPIEDVLVATDKVLEIGYNEPLAKVIPRVEKLHEFLYEWQFRGHAPRQYLAPGLYDRTTATLVSWRKLELSTWSRLFDTEVDKCRQDAGAWWFIAYEATVAGPMSILMESGQDARDPNGHILAYHAEQLLKELSSYLSSSIAGQYAARLDLLRQIQAHLDLLVLDYPAMSVIRNAVSSLVEYYARYESKAIIAIKKGREGLQKKMNDVLLMASWRDTNIEALRESARRSHQKLFRIVRKFRAVLGQPMGPVILQGLPDDEAEGVVQGSGVLSLVLESKAIELKQPQAAAKLCEQLVPGWGSDPHTRRLSTVDRIVSIMAKASTLPESTVDVPDIIATFLTDLLASASALRKETPSVLNNENKDIVKHLKVRKTRLFDETVKTVRQMGFSSNLGLSRVALQASLEMIFSSYSAMRLPEEFDLTGLEYGFHKFIDLAPQVRKALYDHHSDLQHTVARRCVGYMEGILYVALQQRELLAKSTQALASLDRQIAYVDGLSPGFSSADATYPDAESLVALESGSSNHARTVRWLVAVLRVALHLVATHGRLSSSDYRVLQAQLEAWATKLDKRSETLKTDAMLPAGFLMPKTIVARSEAEQELLQLNAEIDQHIAQQPELTYILRQIKLWVSVSGQEKAVADRTDGQTENSLAAFTEEVLNLSKKVLNAVQKFNQSVAELPTSIEDNAWLVDQSTKLTSAVKSLHADTVTSSIEQCIDLLRSVHGQDLDAVKSSAPAALLRVLLPMLQQYATTYRHTLFQLTAVHRSTCQLGHRLGYSFVEISSQGFCTPAEKSDEKSNDTSGKLEDGTGLGDGDGAEDISKDIQPDEDLSELAQTANQEKDKDDGEGIEEEKDAVDMGNDEMEGELGSVAGDEDEEDDKKDDNQDGEDEEDDMDEEAGDVDDLDPTAVDEKMWDGEDDAKDSEKEQQGNEAVGQKNEEEDQAAAGDENAKKPADEQAAAGDEGKPEEEEKEGGDEDGEKEKGEDGDDDDDVGEDDEEAGPQQELNRQDQNVDQNDVLDLPDDMQIDDEEGKDGDDDFDNLEDLENDDDEGAEEEMEESRGKDDDEARKDEEANEEADETMENLEAMKDGEDDAENEEEEEDLEEVEGEGAKEEAQDDEMDVDEEKEEEPAPEPVKDAKTNDKPAPNDVQSGLGQEQDNTVGAEEQEQDDSAQSKNNDAKRDQGEMGQQDSEDQDTTAGGDGQVSKREQENNDDDQAQENPSDANAEQEERQPFKKLGDVLERWHKTRQEIKQAEEPVEQETNNEDSENQAQQQEFQHLHDDDAAPTTQAMGAAEDEEAKPFDDSMAIEEDEQQKPKGEEADKDEAGKPPGNDETDKDDGKEDVAEEDKMQDDDDDADDGTKKTEKDDGRAGASMQKGAYDREDEEDDEMDEDKIDKEDEEDEEELVASQLYSTHLDDDFDDDDESLISMDDAMHQWSAFQTATHPLSLALAAQLRLILTPSQATRLSGGFRTGKRLSIRKIIPYIASGYKRDKIWMRRAVPTKRAYQILLCVDDSKSMGEGLKGASASLAGSSASPGHLALSSLVMVGRALSMLEAGQVGVLGFGARVFTAHALDADQSFGAGASAAGGGAAQTLRRFTFQQDRTDVALLLRNTIDRFKHAREMNVASSSSADLWQLAIILSDGLTPSAAHERIRVLLREAAEARIMVVFVVLDGSTSNNTNNAQKGKSGSAAKTAVSDSVLDLKEAKFIKDPVMGTSRIVIERYLDTFPFPYYLIVHHLDDLPSALSGLLRTWFAEVNA